MNATVLASTAEGAHFVHVRLGHGKLKYLNSGESMVAKLKFKGIDGKAHKRVELVAQFDSTQESLLGPDARMIDSLIVLS